MRSEWLPGAELRLAPTTAGLYRTLMQAYVIPRLGGRNLDQITTADLTRLYADLLASGGRGGRRLAPKTVRHVHTTLRRALADAVKARHLAYNPADGASAPRVLPTRDPKVWSAEQVRAFGEHVSGDRLEALWILAATSGMRRGELLGLHWSDADVQTGTVQVRQVLATYRDAEGWLVRIFKEPKSPASRRLVPLVPTAVQALRAHAGRQADEQAAAGEAYADQGLVFADEIGDPLSFEAVAGAFRRLVAEAKLPPITLHDLRHSFATIALHAGVDVLYVAEVLGHSSPTITASIYQHTRPERKVEAVARVGAAIFG